MPPRRKRHDPGAVGRFAAAIRERRGFDAGTEFFVPFWRRLPDDIDVSAFAGRPIAGWVFTGDDEMVSVPVGGPPGGVPHI
jgi:hypothetical protein